MGSNKSGKSGNSAKSAKSGKSGKSGKKAQVVKPPPPLPKLFEPRNLREFFFVQKIAAIMIQRAWRKAKENRKKSSKTSQWEPKDFASDCRFTSEELFKAMKLLGNFAEYMESQGRKII
jgi:hypothetical protein